MFTKPQTFGSKGYAVIIRILLFLPTKGLLAQFACILSLAIAKASIGLRPGWTPRMGERLRLSGPRGSEAAVAAL